MCVPSKIFAVFPVDMQRVLDVCTINKVVILYVFIIYYFEIPVKCIHIYHYSWIGSVLIGIAVSEGMYRLNL